jgi:hypothetical protein
MDISSFGLSGEAVLPDGPKKLLQLSNRICSIGEATTEPVFLELRSSTRRPLVSEKKKTWHDLAHGLLR